MINMSRRGVNACTEVVDATGQPEQIRMKDPQELQKEPKALRMYMLNCIPMKYKYFNTSRPLVTSAELTKALHILYKTQEQKAHKCIPMLNARS